MQWYILLALTKIYSDFDRFLPILFIFCIKSYYYSKPSKTLALTQPKIQSSPIACRVLRGFSLDCLSDLISYFFTRQYSSVIIMQIFAFSKYSRYCPAPGPLYLLFPLLTHLIHLCSNVMLEKDLPDKPPKPPQTQPWLLILYPYSDLHFSVVLFSGQHRIVSLFLYPTH